MKPATNFKSVIFKRAHHLVNQTGCPFSEALTEAWKRYREYRQGMVIDFMYRITGFYLPCRKSYDRNSYDRRIFRIWSKIENNISEHLTLIESQLANELDLNQ